MIRVKEKLRGFLKPKALRLTRERESLVRALSAVKGHFTVDGLVARMRSKGIKVSRDTLYRNLSLLIEMGVIRLSFYDGGGTLYETQTGQHSHHDHLVCRTCGRVVEFFDRAIEESQTRLARRKGFFLIDHCHQLIGECRRCHSRRKG